jgi:hypothetical protein
MRQVVCNRLRRYCADAVLRTATTEGDWKAREKCVGSHSVPPWTCDRGRRDAPLRL